MPSTGCDMVTDSDNQDSQAVETVDQPGFWPRLLTTGELAFVLGRERGFCGETRLFCSTGQLIFPHHFRANPPASLTTVASSRLTPIRNGDPTAKGKLFRVHPRIPWGSNDAKSSSRWLWQPHRWHRWHHGFHIPNHDVSKRDPSVGMCIYP